MSSRGPPQNIPEDDPIEDMDEEDEELEEVDMFDALGGLLATEDGETIATALVSLKDSVAKISIGIEMQNKILVKLLSALSTKCDCPCKEKVPETA